MKRNILSLNNLKLNQTGYVYKLNCTESVKRRLLDLGLVKNTCITPILDTPSKGLRAFEIRGCLIAIREEDSCLITVFSN